MWAIISDIQHRSAAKVPDLAGVHRLHKIPEELYRRRFWCLLWISVSIIVGQATIDEI